MSFTDEYLELRKKKKKQEEKDIAPLFTNKTTAFFDKDIAPVNNKVTYSDVSSKKEEEDKPWYKSGVFADGFQAGDINQIILSHGKALKDDYLTGGSESAEDDTSKEDEVPWYKKGRFEDGYDFGDVTKTILGVDDDTASLKDLTWNSIKRGYYTARYGEESFAAMQGQANNADELKKLLEGEDYQFTPGNNVASGISGAFELVGQTARQYTHPRTLALTATAAGAAAIAGQAGPQVLVPEEVVTVPTAAIAGFASGSAVAALEIEGGLAYNEMVEAGISAETASKIALAVGTVNAGLEMLQTDELIDAFKATNKAGTKTFTQRILSELKDRGIDIAKETAQEVAQEGVTITGTQVGSKIDNGEWAYTAEDVGNRLLDTAKSSALSFGMMNVPAAGKNIVSIANEQKQENTLTDNEKKVVDKVVEDRIAEEEQDGKELTDKEKTNIRKGVLDELVKGYISTDTIEEVLGGETYKTYKETVDSEDALQSEFDTLYKMKQGDMTGEQIDRMGELRKQLSDLATTSQRNQLKTQLNDEVLGLVKGSRLAESYNEKARRGQAFEADLTKYDAKQQAVVQKAIDSGILNNTNRTHEFVDLVAKVSADKGVLFDFTNNENLKASGFAVDGKSVNGYVTKDGVTVNIQSAKALNSVVGHEITHVLEGTEFYDALQKTLFDYAKSKGEYDSRLANLTELYKDIKDADVNAELTADLVGDYLFTDKEFVQHLSVKNRNIFQKLCDEIKYLCKVATAGSKEARELERVKKAFEDAYRGEGKVTDTKYSISDSDGKQLTKETDKTYADAVNNRDWDTAQKLFDEAAKNAGYTKVVYHGTDARFTEFDTDEESTAREQHAWMADYPDGTIFLAEDYDVANGYGERVMNLLLDTSDIKVFEEPDMYAHRAMDDKYGYEVYNYPVIAVKGKDMTIYATLDNTAIKSADTATYDDNGELIPLSERFNHRNPDIRYSLTEYTEEEKIAHNKAVIDHFGKTYKWAETGYILLDGSKLDLSGKHEGAPGGYRTVDHRDIVDALGSDYGDDTYSGSLVQFMSEGNIRISPESDGINLSVKPNKAQEAALASFIQNAHGEVMLDIDDANGYTVVSVEYPSGTSAFKVLKDIREWFDNGTKPEVSNLSSFRSLSAEDEAPKSYGKYNVYGKDIALDVAPTPETVTPAETAEETAKTEQNVPIAEDVAPETEDLFPNDLAPVEAELESLYQQKDLLETKMQEAISAEDMDAWTTVSAEYDSVMGKIAELESAENERFDSLVNEEAPPEAEEVYSGETNTIDPFRNRSEARVRENKSYQEENPEAKPFFMEAARALLGDIERSTPGKRLFNGEVYYNSGGEKGFMAQPRVTPADVGKFKDTWGKSWEELEKAARNISEGTTKTVLEKRLEFLLNDRMLYGYTDEDGAPIPRNQAYIDFLNAQYANEAEQGAFTDLVAHGDDFAPIDNSAITETPVTEENTTIEAPIAEEYEAIRPKPSKEPKLARATPAEQARAEILTEEPKVNKDKPNAWAKVKNLVLDKGMVFEDLSLATGNRELQAKFNSIRYAEGKAQKLIGEGNAFTNSLKSIQETVDKSGKTKDFYYYLYHKHNIDRMTLEERFKDTPNKPVFGDTISAEDSRQSAAVLENANPEFKQWAEDVYSFNKYLREQLVEGGVISRETADLWETMYPHYVPIRREGDAGLNVNVPLDTGRTGVNAPIKKATGGSRNILPLFDTMGQRAIQTYKAIAKNRFGVELKNTLGTTIENDVVGVDEAIDSIDTQDGLLQEGKNGKKPTFTVFENGKKVTFEITEEMYDAMKPTSDLFSGTSKVLNTISNVRRGTLTEYNPWFMLKNAVKDIQDVLINSQHATKTYANIPSAIKQMATNGHWYQEYMDNGGDQNTYFDNETNTFAKDNKALEIAKKATGLDAISKANNIIERLPRLAEYIASRKAGRSVDVAMLDAARVTTNFAAGGDATKWLNRNGATFLNASVQGAVQQARNIREAKANGLKGWASLAAKYTLAGLPAVLLNSLLWDDDEEYEELSEYVKENYYIVGKFGDGKFVRIPKGRTVAVIQNAFEQMENLITGEDEVDLGRFLDLVVTNLAPNNPLDNNIISPIVQVANNETWYGEDLVPTRLQDLPANEQYDESTDSISRWLGETFNISPVKANYLLDQYSGVVGDTFLPMLTPEAESGDNSFLGNMIAPLKDMFSTDSVMNNQNVSDFYETMDELTTNAKSSTATDKDVLKYKYINSVNAELSELYTKKREIQNSDAPDNVKYAEVRMIQKAIDSMAEESLNTYNDVNIDGNYATVGDRHFRWYEPGEDSNAEAGWQKLTDKQLEKQEDVTSGLGISASEYWSNKEEYDYAYENPEKYAVAKSVGGYQSFRNYSSELYDIKADKDSSGKSISGSRKEKVIDYVNSLDIDYGMRLILFKNEYNADDTYNYDIINYLNSREDITYEDMVSILKELGFTVDSKGNISWD